MTKDFTYRRVTKGDLHKVESVFVGDTSRQVAPPNPTWLEYVTTTPHSFCLLHFLDGGPVAITQFEIDKKLAYVSTFIKQSLRGKGLFQQFMNEALTELPETVSKVAAYISSANHPSIVAFEKFGFEGSLEQDDEGFLAFYFDLKRKAK